jgi:tetratricopeptide (TPR) repeat protein
MEGLERQIEEGVRFQKAGLLDRALEHFRAAEAEARDARTIARAVRRQSNVYLVRCDWARAIESARRAAAAAERAGLDDEFAEALNAEAVVHESRGDYATAIALLEQALAVTGDDRVAGMALQNLGSIAAQQGDLARADSYFRRSVERFERAGFDAGVATALNNYAAAALDRRDFPTALSTSRDAVTAAKRVNDVELLAIAMLNHAEALAASGDLSAAQDQASAGLGYFSLERNVRLQVRALQLLGDICRQQGNTTAAERCYQRGLQLAREIDAPAEIAALSESMAAIRATR